MTIEVQNLKCGGCAATIHKGLAAIDGISAIVIDVEKNSIDLKLDHIDRQEAILKTLTKMGYPPAGANNTFGNKAKSYVSCMIGRVS